MTSLSHLDHRGGRFGRLKAWCLLGLLFFGYIVSLMDRMVLALLIEPVKASFGLSDTGISLLQGAAFMLLYTVVSIPMGRLMDRVRRTSMLSLGIAIWSFSTAACGFAVHAWHLFLARVSVGVGEASLMPAAYSLIPDAFDRERLGTATGFFALGGALGLGTSLIVGGVAYDWLLERGPVLIPMFGILEPWRQLFLLAALPGFLLTLALLRFPEPPRKGDTHGEAPRWDDVWAFVRDNRLWLSAFLAAAALTASVNYISATWMVVFLGRAHGMAIGEAGLAIGPGHMVGSLVGTVFMGYISDIVSRRHPSRRLVICALALAVTAVSTIAYPLVANRDAAILLWTLAIGSGTVPIAAGASNFQENIPNRMRGVVTGGYLIVVNLVGFIGGTTAVAILSDRLFLAHDGIRFAMAWVGGASAAGAAIFFLLSARFQRPFLPEGLAHVPATPFNGPLSHADSHLTNM